MVGTLTLRDARDRLVDGLQQLLELASKLEQSHRHPPGEAEAPRWSLHSDETTMRPFLHQGMAGLEAARKLLTTPPSVPLSQLLEPLELDALTIADDPTFWDRLVKQPNLPDYIKHGLPVLY